MGHVTPSYFACPRDPGLHGIMARSTSCSQAFLDICVVSVGSIFTASLWSFLTMLPCSPCLAVPPSRCNTIAALLVGGML